MDGTQKQEIQEMRPAMSDREVVARAISDWDGSGTAYPKAFEDQSERVQNHFRNGADAVLAALAGRLLPEVSGEVVEAAIDAWCPESIPVAHPVLVEEIAQASAHRPLIREIIKAAAPVIAAATERRVREAVAAEVNTRAVTWSKRANNSPEIRIRADEAQQIAAAIRTGPAS